jgi:hypothetical protein
MSFFDRQGIPDILLQEDKEMNHKKSGFSAPDEIRQGVTVMAQTAQRPAWMTTLRMMYWC